MDDHSPVPAAERADDQRLRKSCWNIGGMFGYPYNLTYRRFTCVPLIALILISLSLPASAETTLSDNWTTGLFCESVSPDKRLNNFFIIDQDKHQMLVASFNEDRVSFLQPPISLSKTPEELVNRKSGLSLNRKTLEMKWRNRKSTCQITSVKALQELAEAHLAFLLGDNQI